MSKLEEAIRDLAREFDAILSNAQSNVNAVAETSREESLAQLSKAQEQKGVLARAEETRVKLEHSINEYKAFQRNLAQLEQVYIISEDLKNVVRNLEKKQK